MGLRKLLKIRIRHTKALQITKIRKNISSRGTLNLRFERVKFQIIHEN